MKKAINKSEYKEIKTMIKKKNSLAGGPKDKCQYKLNESKKTRKQKIKDKGGNLGV